MRRLLMWTALVVGPALTMGGCEMSCQSDEPKIVVDKPATTTDGDVKVTIKETPK